MSNPSNSKRSLWPWAITGYFVIFISFTVGLVMFSMRQKEDLVGENYYDQEIRYQEQLDRMNRTSRLNLPVSVSYDLTGNAIKVSLPVNQAGGPISGQIRLYCPSDERQDREIKLTVNTDGSQTVDASKLRAGLWKVKVYWSVNGQDYFFGKSVVVGSRET